MYKNTSKQTFGTFLNEIRSYSLYLNKDKAAKSYFQQEILIWKLVENINFILKSKWIVKSNYIQTDHSLPYLCSESLSLFSIGYFFWKKRKKRQQALPMYMFIFLTKILACMTMNALK